MHAATDSGYQNYKAIWQANTENMPPVANKQTNKQKLSSQHKK